MANLRAPRSAAFILWLLAGASAMFWALKFVPQPPVPASMAQSLASGGAGSDQGALADSAQVAKALGAELAPPLEAAPAKPAKVLAGRFALTGIVLGAPSRAGRSVAMAMIARDGKPARLYRVGALIEEGVMLQSVDRSSAALGPSMDAAAALTLELPRKKRAGNPGS